jgi:two-component system nitrate/nitrite response regulator NarL
MTDLTAVVCDDDPTYRRVVGMVLAGCGFTLVGEASTAIEAIELAGLQKPAALVLDVSLAGMSGLEAIPLLQEAAPGCAIIVSSAFDSFRETAVRTGATEAVDKADVAALEDALRRVATARAASFL